LIIVPRQKDRFDEMARWLERSGVAIVRRSALGLRSLTLPARHSVILVDTIGELSAVWGLADIAFVGGLLGCLAVLPLNGLTTSTMNFQTFSNLAFAFKITPQLLVQGVFFALVMGVVGGLLPAARAAAQPVATALRSL